MPEISRGMETPIYIEQNEILTEGQKIAKDHLKLDNVGIDDVCSAPHFWKHPHQHPHLSMIKVTACHRVNGLGLVGGEVFVWDLPGRVLEIKNN